jgi:hypothetical protein
VMACQAASATASLREVLKAGPLCRQRTLDPRKISAMALNSTHPGHGTSLIMYLGAVLLLRCSSRAQSLPVRTRDLTPKDSTSSASWYIISSSAPLGGGYSSLALSSTSWSFGCCYSQQASPEPLGSQEPPALSQKAPLPVMLLVVRRAVTLGVVACFEVPADQRVVGRCSCVQYGECEPSIS